MFRFVLLDVLVGISPTALLGIRTEYRRVDNLEVVVFVKPDIASPQLQSVNLKLVLCLQRGVGLVEADPRVARPALSIRLR